MDASTTRLSWGSLPQEIRLLILECVIIPEHKPAEATPLQQFRRASSLATVSREWQWFFEKHNFRRLVLHESDLPAFAKVVRRKNTTRLNYITHLWLHVELATYDCRSCSKPEDVITIAHNNRVFTTSMIYVLETLSSWSGIIGGLTLEISAFSPSDTRHRYYEVEMDSDYPFLFEDDLKRRLGLLNYHREKRADIRASLNSHRQNTIPEERQRLHGTPLEFRPWSLRNAMPTLPSAPIVKGLLIRRQFFRGIALPSLAKLLRESLVALEWFRFERWTNLTRELEMTYCNDLQEHLIPALPDSVRRFFFNQWPRWSSGYQAIQVQPHIRLSISQFMSKSCHRFTEFCPPPHVITETFLNHLILNGRGKGSKTQLLSLRSGRLHPSTAQGRVTSLLATAAYAARTLPRLRILEIWNTGPGYAYIFCYTQDDSRRAIITWRSTGGDLWIAHKVVKAWANVVTTGQVMVKRIPFLEVDGEGLGFNGKSIYRHLALRRLVFDPITMVRLEAEVVLQQEG
ncbi:hypothetical protein BGZ63DRAFT_431803 [Mariannaea sp. PMI_226]|nr:hypothetical protein BGZ63DRAFT_431803 [Mariannaea sp. PMI_226]